MTTKEELFQKTEELSKLDDKIFLLYCWTKDKAENNTAADELREAGRCIRKAMQLLTKQL